LAGQKPQERPSIFDPESSAGLFVGISTFEDERFLQVPYAVDDAVDLAYLFVVELGLVRPVNSTLLLAGEPRKPQSSNKLARLMELGARRQGARQSDIYRFLTDLTVSSSPQGLVALTVATHGVSDQGGDFLVASDSLPNRTLRTGIAVSELFDEVARSRAERRLILLDACRERLSQGTRGLEDSPMARSFADAIAQAKGSVILSGATLGGFAYDDASRKNGSSRPRYSMGSAAKPRPARRDGSPFGHWPTMSNRGLSPGCSATAPTTRPSRSASGGRSRRRQTLFPLRSIRKRLSRGAATDRAGIWPSSGSSGIKARSSPRLFGTRSLRGFLPNLPAPRLTNCSTRSKRSTAQNAPSEAYETSSAKAQREPYCRLPFSIRSLPPPRPKGRSLC
jgi:hypothetical protein